MSRNRNKGSGTKTATCDVCLLSHPSTVEGTKHRRCGGAADAPIRAKHSANSGVRGTWR